MGARRLLVADHQFILATRDTGYRGVANAVAELIDNSIQAGASDVRVFVREGPGKKARVAAESDVAIAVLDNGEGMNRDTLWTALQFGGTERFGNRQGLGRFGMGLPNSSVSQSRRVELYTWRSRGSVLFTYLDVDEVARRELRHVPRPVHRRLPAWADSLASETGTLVVWSRCDRLAFRRTTTVAQRMRRPLGRMYRHLIWRGLRISVNDETVAPVDPLFCRPDTGEGGAVSFGSVLAYEVASPAGRGTAKISVRFTELPVALWQDLSVEEKRDRGIVGGAGASFVRAGREVDYGWQLMGSKRKENYDDWWRCEVCFDPELDEFFGVTHSKQGVAPTPQLQAMLSPDLESAARTLNSRVRAAFESLKRSAPSRATQVATRQDVLLPPARPQECWPRPLPRRSYVILTAKLRGRAFFDVAEVNGKLSVTINMNHPFFERIYSPALEGHNEHVRYALECLILAAARAELGAEGPAEQACLERHRSNWGDSLAAFLERKM